MNPHPTATSLAMDRNWALVAAGAVLGCVGIGALFALAVLLQPMGSATGWSRAGLSSAMTLAFLAMGLAGFGWGTLSDRVGPRVCVLAGSLLQGLACILASRAGSAEIRASIQWMVGRSPLPSSGSRALQTSQTSGSENR